MGLKSARATVEASESGSPAPARPNLASTQRWTQGAALTTRALTMALWALLACGPLALVVVVLQPDPPPPAAATTAPSAGEVAVVGESAVQAVHAWLTATRDAPGAFAEIYPDVQTSALPEVAAVVSDASVASVFLLGSGVWSVTVGVDAQWPAEDGSVGPAQRLYFEVPVASAGDELAASTIALPAPVAAPERASGASLQYQSAVSASSELGTTVGEYLQALLTGQGDVSRYASPGVDARAITPAPFTAVDVRRLWATEPVDPTATPQDGQRAQVLVDVVVTPADGIGLAAQYRLELTGRAGRWEVSQMQASPAVRAESDATAPATEGAAP